MACNNETSWICIVNQHVKAFILYNQLFEVGIIHNIDMEYIDDMLTNSTEMSATWQAASSDLGASASSMCNIVRCSFTRHYFTTCVGLNGHLQVYRLLYFRTLLLTVMQLLSYSRISHFHYHVHKSPPLIPILSRLIQSIPPHHISLRSILILWHVDPLLGNDSEIINYATAITRQRPVKSNRGMVFNMRFSHCWAVVVRSW
jgi:hypothetical protein